jgi:hypothetical protein
MLTTPGHAGQVGHCKSKDEFTTETAINWLQVR